MASSLEQTVLKFFASILI